MKLAVISDTHDHLENLEKAIVEINTLGVGALLHCGDLCSPFVIDRLATFNGPVHVVFGNNEGDRFTINNVSKKFPNVKLHGEVGFVETENGEVPVFAQKTARFSAASGMSILLATVNDGRSSRSGRWRRSSSRSVA